MAEMTLEQQQALALANARMRAAQARASAAPAPSPVPPSPNPDARVFDPMLGELPITNREADELARQDAQNGPGMVEAIVRGVGQGATLNGGDEVGAGLEAARGATLRAQGRGQNAPTFESALAEAQASNAAAQKAHPWAYGAGQVAGTVPGLVYAGSTRLGAQALGLVGKTLLTRGLKSGASGATLNGIQGYLAGEGDNRTQGAADGVEGGGLLGFLAPGVGQLIGQGARAASGWIAQRFAPVPNAGNGAARLLTQDFEASGGRAPIEQRLNELGPNAMLLDASPSFQGSAQGLAVRPETRELIVDAVKQRQAATTQRLNRDLNDAAGPAPVPSQVEAQFQQGVDKAGPLYEQSLRQPVRVDTSALRKRIDDLASTEKGGAESALGRVRNTLRTNDPVHPDIVVPEYRPAALHNAKEEIDSMIRRVKDQPGGAESSEYRNLTIARKELNEALEAQVPGYAEANQQARTFERGKEAFQEGQSVLNRDVHPADVAQRMETAPMEQQAGMRLGLRAKIDREVGNTANDLNALRQVVKGEGDWNRQKLASVFGDDEADKIINAVDREAAFRDAYNKTVENSQTEMRRQAAGRYSVAGETPHQPDLALTIAGATGGPKGTAIAAAVKGGRAGVTALQRDADLARNKEIARILQLREGPELTAVLGALDRRLALRDTGDRAGTAVDRVARAILLSQGYNAGETGNRLFRQP